ncbi:MAG TPA: putative toxin-antitoxin system toxin component, PIN family [Gemmatimonadaceae bacterium]|nr:putative toxin-antitoxin system toxin component, PIN family [Gemmatimonadaceae bacterium]
MFLDTNVLVSAFTARGLSADLMRLVLAEHEVLTGEVNLQELRRVLGGRSGASEEQLRDIESQLRDHTIVARPSSPADKSIRDSDDLWVVASATAGQADMLVTGDRDLLEVKGKPPLSILSPRSAWEMLRTQ